MVFIITSVVLFLLLKRQEKIKHLLILMVAFIWTILFTPSLENFLFNNLPGQFLVSLIRESLQAFSIYLLSFLWKKLINLSKPSIRTSYLTVGIGVALVLVILIILGLKPAFLGDRFRQITLNTIISQERWILWRWFKNIPNPTNRWLGRRRMGSLLFCPSIYPYFSENTHNYFLQVMIEIGIIGLLATIGLIIGLFIKFIVAKR